jgi:eukaryotic-like serine/threonine-protein kinase
MSSAPLPDEVERFIGFTRKSGLVDEQRLNAAMRDLRVSHSNPSLSDLCHYLSTHDILTEWQIGKLRNGQFKGFFMDGYKLLSHIVARETYSAFLAEQVDTGRRVALLITPRHLRPGPELQYRVVEPGDA